MQRHIRFRYATFSIKLDSCVATWSSTGTARPYYDVNLLPRSHNVRSTCQRSTAAAATCSSYRVSATAATCSAISASISFLISRLFGRSLVLEAARESPTYQSIDAAFSNAGFGTAFTLIFLLRLSPILPFSWANYVFGLSGVQYAAFLLGTLAGCLPAIAAYVFSGQLGAEMALNGGESSEQLLAQFDGTARSAHGPERGRMDLRSYGVGAQILRDCGVQKMRLLGTPRRMPSMTGYGLEITGYLTKE